MRTLLLLWIILLLTGLPQSGSAQDLAVIAEKLYTMSPAGVLTDGVVLIENGKIRAVGNASDLRIPSGIPVLRTAVATPGFVDAHASVGLSGAYNVTADQDIDENTEPNTAELRAIDGYLPTEMLVRYLLEQGVTTVHVGPGYLNPIAGQSAIFKTTGNTVQDALVQFPAAMMLNLGEAPKFPDKAPTTRMATAMIIRKALQEAIGYAQKQNSAAEDEKPPVDLRQAALAQVTDGTIPAVITCHRSDDIMTALRLAKEFNLRLIIDGGTDAFLLRDEIKAAGVPVLVAPTMQRPGNMENLNGTFESAAFLWKAGIPIAIQSGFESYVPKTRIISFEAGVAMANRLPEIEALRAITISPAKILGISNRVGSLETGKDADIVLLDGAPLEYLTHVEAVIVEGKTVYER
jgi:imidazolonepropionase-like amidohydrolase